MTGERWTFLVVRGDNAPVRQFTVSTRLLRVGAWCGGFVFLAILAFGLGMGLDGAARYRAFSLQARNDALESELAQFQGRIGELESALDHVAANGARFRSVAGLEQIDPEVLEAGVGGPGLGSPESSPLWAVDSLTSKSVFAASYDLSALERRARLLSASLAEATDSVLAHRALLEATPSIRPTTGWLSSTYSLSRMHPIHHRPLPHEGMDISAPKGTPIHAAAKGRVVRAGWAVGYGLTVEIDHGFGFTTLYGHASKLLVEKGQTVERGDVIAQVGSTGVATGSHLHYEVRVNDVPQNPAQYILPDAIPN